MMLKKKRKLELNLIIQKIKKLIKVIKINLNDSSIDIML